MYEIFEHLLQKFGLTVYRVAKDTGITQTTLSNWRDGKSNPSLRTLQKIANYFSVPVDYLVSGNYPANVPPETVRLADKVQRDARLEAAIMQYFTLSDKRKELVLSLVETLAEK